MAGLGHLGFGFAAKPVARKVPLWVLLISTELLDLLWGLYFSLQVETGTDGG